MYTEKQISNALEAFDRVGSITAVINQLGYPSRTMLYNWLKAQGTGRRSPKETAQKDLPATFCTAYPARRAGIKPASLDLKLKALRRCFEEGEDVTSVAMDIGYSRTVIYGWRKRLQQKGMTGLMPPKKAIKRGKLAMDIDVQAPAPSDEIQQLHEQISDMKMDIDILKETILVLKKDHGVDMQKLHNREKAVIIDAMSKQYSLPLLFKKLHLSKSSYYYSRRAMRKPSKYTKVENTICSIFQTNYQCYGYRRIKVELQHTGITLSEKVVRRLMKEYGLSVIYCHRAKYSSYKGEISPEVPDLLKRDFHAVRPESKWLTDITEFSIPAGKVYLSAIIDCYDGGTVSWKMGVSPNAELANLTLDMAYKHLSEGVGPIILHSDRGCHYRWPGWIELTKRAGIIRSMSRKGCSPDNAACEGFFGRLKNECFYHRSFAGYSTQKFIKYIDDYIKWYNEKRIKSTLGYLSPKDYRKLHLDAA